MGIMDNYPSDCDYLRHKFDLKPEISFYELINVVTTYIKSLEEVKKQSVVKTEQEKSQGEKKCQTQTTKSK